MGPTLWVVLLGVERDLVERCRGFWSTEKDDLVGLLDKASTNAAVAAAAVTAATAAVQRPEMAAAKMHTPRTALFTVEFWMVFCVMATVCGSNSATMVGTLLHFNVISEHH